MTQHTQFAGCMADLKPANTGDAAQDVLLDKSAFLRGAAAEGERRAERYRLEAAACDSDVASIRGELAQVEAALARLRS